MTVTKLLHLRKQLKLFKFNRGFESLPDKQRSELQYWFLLIDVIIRWYRGKIPHLYGLLPPIEKMKVRGYGLRENAIRTFTRFENKRYLDRLLIPPNYFKGMRILDVGSGPLPFALAFTNCEIFCLDQLIEHYKHIGYLLDTYSERMAYTTGCTDKMPFEDNFFDAVISVNAIDHVDNLEITSREITRVLKPEGILRFDAHYHEETICEPLVLNDEKIIKHFGHLGIVKIHERLFTEQPLDIPAPDAPERGEKLVIWANREE